MAASQLLPPCPGASLRLNAGTSHTSARATIQNGARRARAVASLATPQQSSHGRSVGPSSSDPELCQGGAQDPSRRLLVALPLGAAAAALAAAVLPPPALADDAPAAAFTDMPALRGKDYGKTRTKYPDYIETPSGLQYKDLREGTGATPKPGDLVVIDWDGFTIGYYGRIFEARNKAKGGSFEGSEKDFFRFRVGAGEVIPAIEEAIATMQVGSVRRLVVPPELGYPDNDYNKSGPRPLTFSGQRTLDFVLKNQGLIDKTLLFDIELMKVLPS